MISSIRNTMDKLVLNTEIVSMRHEVRRARVHTINKLIRTAKKLKTKNGSEKDKEKFQRKAARFLEEIQTMKVLKDDEISKYSLINKKEPADVIADPKTSIKERSLARLSCHSSIVSRVKQFRKKFPTWDENLPQLLTQLGTKSKKKKEKVKKNKKADQKNSKSHISGKKVENSAESANEEDNTESSTDIEDLHSASKEPTFQTKKTKKKGRDKLTNNDNVNLKMKVPKKTLAEVKKFSEVFLNSENNDINDNTDFMQNVSDDEDNSNCGIVNTYDKVKIKHGNYHSDFNEKKFNDDSSANDEDLNVKSDSAKVVDPFFVCEDGETSYLSSVQKNETEDREDSSSVKQTLWKKDVQRVFKHGERKRNALVQRPKNFNPHKFSYDDKNEHGHIKQFPQRQTKNIGTHIRKINESRPTYDKFQQKQNKNINSSKMDTGITVQGNEPIHPSWEAKRKLKEQQHAVSAFQGKKIKFED
ncbi:hypothetical protein C0J52_06943 [Blattella germanica]|nr:hypothetical protein C0J52_06943 [Blattella germanica]